MFNTAGVKTFDSNFVQLVPYSISDNFALPTNDTATNLYLPVPTNPAYLLPKTAVAFASQRTVSGTNFTDYAVFDIAFKRRGQYIDSKTMRTVSETEMGNFAPGFAAYFAGTYTNLSVIAVDADLYIAPGGGTGGGTNPTYSLSSFMTPEEGQSIAVTLITTGLANGSTVPYTITGISQADLTVGTLTGNFTISSNTGGLEFRFARDTPFEYETMRISVNNGNTFLDIPITDVPAGNEVLTISPNSITTTQTTNVTITGGAPNTSFEFSFNTEVLNTTPTSISHPITSDRGVYSTSFISDGLSCQLEDDGNGNIRVVKVTTTEHIELKKVGTIERT
jgi:hypothetical protein